MEKESSNIKKLTLAWNLILKQCIEKAEKDARELGPGMSIFAMKKNPTSIFNCSYYYLQRESGLWGKYVNYSPNGTLINKIYDPNRMFIISVHVPDSNNPEETLGNTRIFEFGTLKEVDITEKDT